MKHSQILKRGFRLSNFIFYLCVLIKCHYKLIKTISIVCLFLQPIYDSSLVKYCSTKTSHFSTQYEKAQNVLGQFRPNTLLIVYQKSFPPVIGGIQRSHQRRMSLNKTAVIAFDSVCLILQNYCLNRIDIAVLVDYIVVLLNTQAFSLLKSRLNFNRLMRLWFIV